PARPDSVHFSPSDPHCVPRYFLVKRSMSWDQSRAFCQRHFVDLAVMNTEREYWHVYNKTDGEKVSFWIGLLRTKGHNWTWVDGGNLHYEQWLNNNLAPCGSFEAMLTQPKKMCPRYCHESHASVCQGKS
uniref:C-type lectin domain-containing protein n=1 Tax=Periophthalmus magnuspinnatus TaxID=409849 RepID=A0A3B4AED8_9GOBI